MAKPFSVNIASDYGVVRAQWFEFYYGYEYVIEGKDGEEWCFVAKRDGKEILRVPFSVLSINYGIKSMNSIEECLMAGIAWVCVNRDSDNV